MTFTFSRLRDRKGNPMPQPKIKCFSDVTIDLDENSSKMCVFDATGSFIAEIKVMKLGIHALGIRVYGIEELNSQQFIWQEYWLQYKEGT